MIYYESTIIITTLICTLDSREKYRPKHRSCGHCENCKRVENCGLCLGCSEMRRFGGSDLCENKTCLNVNKQVKYSVIIILY